MRQACDEAHARIITGDTKVMGRGEIDRIVINTTGIGLTPFIIRDCTLGVGDRIIVTGTIGDHGLAVMATRHGLALDAPLLSDVAPINGLVRAALARDPRAVTAMKDPTRGGLASALHEMASKSHVGIVLDEAALPVRPEARGVAELVGIDPLMIANEGKAVLGVKAAFADDVLAALRTHPQGRDAAIIGTVTDERPGMIILDTGFGRRLIAEPEGEPLPRIC
ncbi:MAG: AIR synthase-related protein [Vicinamibacterales bacterium]